METLLNKSVFHANVIYKCNRLYETYNQILLRLSCRIHPQQNVDKTNTLLIL